MPLPSQHIWSYTTDPDSCCQWSPHVGFWARFTGDKSLCRWGKEPIEMRRAIWGSGSVGTSLVAGVMHIICPLPWFILSVSDNVLCDDSFLCWQMIYGTWFLFVFLTFYSTTVLTHILFAVWFLSSSFSPCSLALQIYIARPIHWPNHYDRCTCLSAMTLLTVINCVLKSSQKNDLKNLLSSEKILYCLLFLEQSRKKKKKNLHYPDHSVSVSTLTFVGLYKIWNCSFSCSTS